MRPAIALTLAVFIVCCEDNPAVRTPPYTCRMGIHKKVFPVATAADILFVVDNSDSMCEEQENLARNFSAFITEVEKAVNDYQIGITTTDVDTCEGEPHCECKQGGEKVWAGKLVAAQGNPKIITKSTPNMALVFADNVRIGTGGCGFEKGLEAMKLALSAPNTDPGGPNDGFLRSAGNVMLVVIFVTDEDDCSHPPGALPNELTACETYSDRLTKVSSYVDFLRSLKADDFGVAAIAGGNKAGAEVEAGNCINPGIPQEILDACGTAPGEQGAFAAKRYYELVQAVSSAGATGIFDTICSEDFSKTMVEIAQALFPTCRAELASRPDCDDSACQGELLVKIDDRETERPDCWNYVEEEDTYRIEFTEQCCPAPGAKVEVYYITDIAGKCSEEVDGGA